MDSLQTWITFVANLINMKKIILLYAILQSSLFVISQPLTRTSNLVVNIIPQVASSGTGTRTVIAFNLTINGLQPNTTYRYFTAMGIASNVGSTAANPGAGNPLFIRNQATSYSYSTSASLTTAGGYDSILTNSIGSYTGWFAVVNTGNTRFNAGNYIYPIVVLDSAGLPGVVSRRWMVDTDSILCLAFGTTTTTGTGIYGRSLVANRGGFVALYDNISGSGKPLTITPVQNFNVSIASTPAFYTDSVQGITGAWGSIIPNTLTNGVRRIELRNYNNVVADFNTSTNGLWGSVNTVNPNGGTTALRIDIANAPLPVSWGSIEATTQRNGISINWTTISETNNAKFVVEHSINGRDYTAIGRVGGAGNSNRQIRYNYLHETANLQATNYYRIKQVDFDGKFEYSRTVTVQPTRILNQIVETTPNPFNNTLDVLIQAEAGTHVNIELMDMIGKVVSSQQINIVGGKEKASFNTEHLNNGVYFIRIQQGSETITRKVIKR
jgi:hypothetical protein